MTVPSKPVSPWHSLPKEAGGIGGTVKTAPDCPHLDLSSLLVRMWGKVVYSFP